MAVLDLRPEALEVEARVQVRMEEGAAEVIPEEMEVMWQAEVDHLFKVFRQAR